MLKVTQFLALIPDSCGVENVVRATLQNKQEISDGQLSGKNLSHGL